MRWFIIFLMVVSGLSACAQINRESRDYYSHKNQMRHGIIPRSVPATGVQASRADLSEVQRGEKLYQAHCMQCHGVDGSGPSAPVEGLNYDPPSLIKLLAGVEEFDFYMALSRWKGEMPGWEHPFSQQELREITAYLQTLVH